MADTVPNTPEHGNCFQPTSQTPTDNQGENDSVISDRCWEARYKSDSRKWLLRDGNPENMRTETWSTTKTSFGYPKEEVNEILGRRAEIMLERMRREAKAEAIAENILQPKIEKYITTYDDTYCPSDPNFDAPPKPPPRLRELYEKYPLYDNPAASYWQLQHAKHVAERPAVGGMMKTVNYNNPFKRNSHFSKPLEDLTDGGPVVR